MLEFAPTQTRKTATIDAYAADTVALYTPPAQIFDFPACGTQLHMHSNDGGTTLYGGGFKMYGEDRISHRMNGYELAMADHLLHTGGLSSLRRGSDY